MASKKTDLVYDFRFPQKLKWIDKPTIKITITYKVDSKSDINPLFLQELSSEVRAGYLKPLNDAWMDMFSEWDADFTRLLPELAGADATRRKKFIADAWKPLEKEFAKQLQNMKEMAQTIGDRYWDELARQHSEIKSYKRWTGVKASWSALTIGASVTTIVVSGGAASASYFGALKGVYDIYKLLQDYRASAEDYHGKVFQSFGEARATRVRLAGLWERPAGVSDKVLYTQIVKDTKKLKSQCQTLKSQMDTFSVKIHQYRRKAGEASAKLDVALNKLEEAFHVNPSEKAKQETSIHKLIKQVGDMFKQHKEMEAFLKKAKAYHDECLKLTGEMSSLTKLLKKGEWPAKTAVSGVIGSAMDNSTLQLARTGTVSTGKILDNWADKLAIGLKLLTKLIP